MSHQQGDVHFFLGKLGFILWKASLGRQTWSLWVCSSSSPLLPFLFLYPQLLLMSLMSHSTEYHFGQVSWLCPLSTVCVSLASLLGGQHKKQRTLDTASSGQQQLKNGCVLNTVFTKHLKHSTIQAILKKINWILAKTSTSLLLCFSKNKCNWSSEWLLFFSSV